MSEQEELETEKEVLFQEEIRQLTETKIFLQEKHIFFKHNCNNHDKVLTKKLLEIINHMDTRVRSECKHEYEEDYIDINPDRSEKISYCKICWCTFPQE